jgi:hypothetical protein
MSELSPELTALMSEVTGTEGRFGHRQHVHLAFLAARRYGQARAGSVLCDWITQIAAAHGTPGKYHATMTIAWAEIVAHHVAADLAAADFATFASRHPGLFDKSLLVRHYTAAVLGSSQARTGWVPPDRVPFPWA